MTKATKTKGMGRGGARVGAGRPRKPGSIEVAAARKPGDIPLDDASIALSDLKTVALSTLRQILECSQSDSARVSAAREILIRAHEEAELTGENGRKAQAKKAAERLLSDGGKFASSPPPPGKPKMQ